jgi:hypothetical protein
MELKHPESVEIRVTTVFVATSPAGNIITYNIQNVFANNLLLNFKFFYEIFLSRNMNSSSDATLNKK